MNTYKKQFVGTCNHHVCVPHFLESTALSPESTTDTALSTVTAAVTQLLSLENRHKIALYRYRS